MPITIHPGAGKELRMTVDDLARVVGEMTGSRPEIRETAEPTGIVIGTTQQFGVFKDEPGLAIHADFDGREAYIIRPDDKQKRIWILGNREDGASHGVYSLLRENGYRALFPGKAWEVIPVRKEVAVSAPSEGRPKVLTRLVWAGWGSFDKQQSDDVELWKRRNRMGASISGQIGHSWESFIHKNPEAFKANPLLFGEKQDGSPNKNSLRHGTPAAVDFTATYLESLASSSKSTDILSIAPTDGNNYSYDEETLARGDVSESFYWYANEVAKRLQQTAPGKLVGTTAYYKHAKPPSFSLAPNILVLGATQFGSGGMSLEDFFTAWSTKTKYLGIRDYIYSGYQYVADHPDGGVRRASLERQRQWLLNYPVVYYSAEGLWEWGVKGLGYYALAQLLWDPTQEVDEILQDFTKSAYGPASEAMDAYYEALEPKGKAVRDYQMARGVDAIRNAALAAKDNPAATARIDEMKLYMIHVALMDKMRGLKSNDPDRWKLAADDLEWNFRNRRGYMLNYNCNRKMWMVRAQLLGNHFIRDRNTYYRTGQKKPETAEEQNKEIKEVLGESWQLKDGYVFPDGKVAATLLPAKPAEIRDKFDHLVVSQYPPIKLNEVDYTTDFVPVDTGLTSQETGDEALWFGNSPKWIGWFPAAKKLEWEITPNVRYSDRIGEKPHKLTVEHSGEKPVIQELIQDGKAKSVVTNISGSGISSLYFNTARMGMIIKGKNWEHIAMPTSADATVFIGTLPRDSGLVAKPVYFYVPKGVTEIQAFTELPDRVIKQARFSPFAGEPVLPRVEGEFLKISVPAGQDGRMWKVVGGGLGTRFYFLNLPNILCFHPGKVMLPREVAEKDGLRIVESGIH